MATIPQPYLFSWKEIDEASDLDRLRLVLDALPDEKLVTFLEAATWTRSKRLPCSPDVERGHRRDRFSASVCGVAFARAVAQWRAAAALWI